ncbi:unnamed protein product [Rangifer tarandus platyrhynchus]|uniref:Uncharacterized protein n=1 Tax=Rangifer tarandus platyrhynchus TaxID=3082113 RepID=A0AC59ZF78_RANTA
MEPQTTTEPGGGTGAVRAEPPRTGFIRVRTDAHVFRKKPSAWREERGQEETVRLTDCYHQAFVSERSPSWDANTDGPLLAPRDVLKP